MEGALAAIEGTALAQTLRNARWGYAAVNAAHIFGIALLFGAITPLNLRLLGVWKDIPRASLARVLAPMAGAGLALAVAAGLLLFSIRAREYADIRFFQIKLALVAIGTCSALLAHARHGAALEKDRSLRVHAVVSLLCWTGAIVCGRFIAFADS
ncbi:MAG: hypothetical protein RIC52_00330 [Amphiplicatus sp.]